MKSFSRFLRRWGVGGLLQYFFTIYFGINRDRCKRVLITAFIEGLLSLLAGVKKTYDDIRPVWPSPPPPKLEYISIPGDLLTVIMGYGEFGICL